MHNKNDIGEKTLVKKAFVYSDVDRFAPAHVYSSYIPLHTKYCFKASMIIILYMNKSVSLSFN